MAFIRYFIAVPRIVLSDQTCSQTDKLVYGIINSLSNKKEYCYASNHYFSKVLGVCTKTISNSIQNLASRNYIYIKYVDNQRQIYINEEIVREENAKVVEKKFYDDIERNCQYKRKDFIKDNKNAVPYWLEHSEVCKSEELDLKDKEELESIVKKYKED